ncbi:hypothetical protein CAEBREN_23739 [Caenorhabditis brenneri]|uniref:Uncharacterized protein n=1 Tax=Caenorhabditis brenneri TaxID=135651 RepID=G0N341_CAEBE|nr:hypothetical protein CAEBREN_23739 [Caenorhabditis brenneri]
MWKLKVLINPDTGKVLCSKCSYYHKKMKSAVEFTACYLFFLRTGEARVAGRKRLRRDGTVEKHHKKEKQKRYYEFEVDSIHLRGYQRRVRDPESVLGSPETTMNFSKLFLMKAMLDSQKLTKTAPRTPLKSFRIVDILGLKPTASGAEESQGTSDASDDASDAPDPVWAQVDDEIQVLENPEVQNSVTDDFQSIYGSMDPKMVESAMKIALASLDGAELQKLVELDEQQRIDNADDVPCSDHLRKTNQWRDPEESGDKNQPAPKT